MSKTFSKIWLHLVWSTKDRAPAMPGQVKRKVCEHIKANARSKAIHVDTINGTSDHLHLLVGVQPGQSASDVVNLIKGESAHWANSTRLTGGRFVWQDGFGAFSVSASQVDAVRKYIRGQEEHHRKMSFAEEVALFCEKYGVTMGRP